jgi:hypothetical protein
MNERAMRKTFKYQLQSTSTDARAATEASVCRAPLP